MKYIVDIDDFEPLFKVDSIGVFGIGKSVSDSDNDHSWSRIKSIEEFEELNSDYINEHFSDLQDTAYQRGLEDGKKVNDKGCEGCKLQGTDSNICDQCCNSYANQWKSKDDKIEVGDEVYFECDNTSDSGVVTWVGKNNVCIMKQDGSAGENSKDKLLKTGRHFDISKILEEMRND